MSRGFGSLAAFSAFVGTRMGRLVDHGAQIGIEEGARHIAAEAKRVMGSYEYNWPPLKTETVEHKAAGDTPLVETGHMRDSIQTEAGYHRARVFSDDPKFAYHELGTSKTPARPVLSETAIRHEEQVAHHLGKRVVAAMTGHDVEIIGSPHH